MGLIHTPRVLYNIGKGFYKKKRRPSNVITATTTTTKSSSESSSISSNTINNNNTNLIGVGKYHPHIYTSRVGLFDIDYLGHMNNGTFFMYTRLFVACCSSCFFFNMRTPKV